MSLWRLKRAKPVTVGTEHGNSREDTETELLGRKVDAIEAITTVYIVYVKLSVDDRRWMVIVA